METVPLRTGSISVHCSSPFAPGSPRVSFTVHDSIGAAFSCEKVHVSSPRISLQFGANRRGIRRVLSESDVIRSEINVFGCPKKLSSSRSRSFQSIISDEGFTSEYDELRSGNVGSLTSSESGFDKKKFAGERTGRKISVQQLEIPGDGTGNYGKFTGGNRGGDGFGTSENDDQNKIGAYYQEMLKTNPSDPLLLRNYGKFLHEVKRDTVRAEEYYGRAILASPGDGELLSLYGKLIWETQRDEDRAKCYFDQAVQVAPDDCVVLGSYAHFMWEAGDDEDNEIENEKEVMAATVEAF